MIAITKPTRVGSPRVRFCCRTPNAGEEPSTYDELCTVGYHVRREVWGAPLLAENIQEGSESAARLSVVRETAQSMAAELRKAMGRAEYQAEAQKAGDRRNTTPESRVRQA